MSSHITVGGWLKSPHSGTEPPRGFPCQESTPTVGGSLHERTPHFKDVGNTKPGGWQKSHAGLEDSVLLGATAA